MPKPLDQATRKIIGDYGLDPKECLWDCRGTWVMYHRYVEQIAALAGITFDLPQIIEADTANKTAVICVTGHMGDRSEWSFGEATPSNNQNAYAWAMAEKRAKDRVALKLVGLAGFVYSEEEADDFKASAPAQPNEPSDEYQILYDDIWADLMKSPDLKDLKQVWSGRRTDLGDLKSNYPKLYEALEAEKDAKKTSLEQGE